MKNENFLFANFYEIVNIKTVKTDKRIVGDTVPNNLRLNPFLNLKGHIVDISFSLHLIL